MTGIVMAWIAGACAAAWMDWDIAAPTYALVGIAVLWRGRLQAEWLAGLAGFLWVAFHVVDYNDLRARASGEFRLVGTVVDLPRSSDAASRFNFCPDPGQGLDGATVRLSWFEPPPALRAGQRLSVTAKLRPARGLANPGQFDFETWAFAAGIHATGYVREGRVIGPASGWRSRLDALRQGISERLRAEVDNAVARRILPALAVADRRQLTDAQWEVFRGTGTSHLLAISGLHIGLAGSLGIGLGALVWRLRPRAATRRGFGLALGLPVAVCYAALAGFSLSTVRALIMFATLCVCWWSRIGTGFWTGLAWAAAAVVVIDPAAPASTGFWLSFGAVAALAVAFRGRSESSRIRRVLGAQLAVFLGLLPITLGVGLQPSWTAPLINLAAIPWVGTLVVPPLLAGVAAATLFPQIAAPLLGMAEWAVSVLYAGLEFAATAPLATRSLQISGVGLLWLLVGVGIAALPRGTPGRALAPLIIVAALWPHRQSPGHGEVDLHVLDVGQGLAMVVQTANHVMLFDTGPRSRSGWSAGREIVAPFVKRLTGGRIELAVISHADADHAGGWQGLVESGVVPLETISSRALPNGESGECRLGDRWEWDGVGFEVLHPGPGLPYVGNDSSCVVLVTAGERRVLLPGDASAAVEARILPMVRSLDVLVAGHHGSRSSSSSVFLDVADPAWVVFSAGYGNRFGMPHRDVLDRVRDSRTLNTAVCGYLHLRIAGAGVSLIKAERESRTRPWHPGHAQDDDDENQYDCAS